MIPRITRILPRPDPCHCEILKMNAPPSHRHICILEKRWRGHLERNSQCPSLLKPPTNALFALFRKRDHVAKQLLLHLCRRGWEEKELVCQIPKSDNPRVHEEDPLSGGLSTSRDVEPLLEGLRSYFSRLMTTPRS